MYSAMWKMLVWLFSHPSSFMRIMSSAAERQGREKSFILGGVVLF